MNLALEFLPGHRSKVKIELTSREAQEPLPEA